MIAAVRHGPHSGSPPGNRTLLVCVRGGATAELRGLVAGAGMRLVGVVEHGCRKPDAAFFIGRGKLEELRVCVQEEQAARVIFDHALSPVQERNLSRELGCTVLDRTSLILHIFSLRAHSYEGKLQVELAKLQHMSTRLVRGWTHLERQRGGVNLRSGPGEAQIELDRRMLNRRIRTIRARLEKVRTGYQTRRRVRRRSSAPIVALVGYTNAGKTTLFNRLTKAQKTVANRPFTTLDPTTRRYTLPDGRFLLLSDTVGFLDRLPHELIAAFSATLEETRHADLLLHVVDRADADYRERMVQVQQVIHTLGAGAVPVLEVYNKTDLVEGLSAGACPGISQRVHISATTGVGLTALAKQVSARLWPVSVLPRDAPDLHTCAEA